MGLGFTVGLTIIGMFREILGVGQVFGITILPEAFPRFTIFVMAPGAFFVLAALTAIQNAVKMKKKGVKALSETENCASCSLNCGCSGFCPEKNKEAK